VESQFNKKGADILFITPSGDVFADPGTYTCMGYMMLFHYLKEKYGLDITWSTYASEGGNFGFFTSHETMKRLNAKMYAEAKRLGVKWILGGECGHMWRVINQYMDTMNGPADFLEEPVNPITGTKFENAKSTKMVHITEFTADLIKHGKLELDPSRNDNLKVTFHDSCNPARGMGMLEEPRYVINNVANNFYDMPANTIREQTFCCGSGSGLNAGEDMELRMAGGLPRANAVKHVHEKHGVNMLATICAIDRAALPASDGILGAGSGCHRGDELVANALIMPGEKNEPRTCAVNHCREWRMPMNDKKWILIGLVIFVGLFSFPLWYNIAIKAGKAAPAPEVVLTEKAKAAEKCVMSTAYMQAEHMQLLDLWRHSVVRNAEREFVNPEGKTFNMSLSNTCLDCHSNKAEFCDRCHNYASVRPYCWDCHIDNPKGEE
jgi:hypothetical protein